GRLLQLTDADGYTQKYAYDGIGNKISYTNQIGNQPVPVSGMTQAQWAQAHTWYYQYDAAGRLLGQISPGVATYALSASDTNISTSLNASNIREATVFSYDAYGNLTSQSHGTVTAITNSTFSAISNALTTSYSYDALNRQVSVTQAPVSTYSPTLDDQHGYDANTADFENPAASISSETHYDALGNAIVGKDGNGAYSYKIYDQLGRVAEEVDAGRG